MRRGSQNIEVELLRVKWDSEGGRFAYTSVYTACLERQREGVVARFVFCGDDALDQRQRG